MRRGITLLEVLVAGSLMAIGLVAALEVVAGCAATTRRVQDQTRAMAFARSKMDEVLKQPILQVGTDQGQGVDQTTDYDWQVVIEQSQHPLLMLVAVEATNRITGQSVTLTALRRPDLQDPQPSDTTGSATGTTSP